MNKNKKKLSALLAGGTACLLLAGSFAYFTDQEYTSASATAGNIDLTWKNATTNLSGAQEDANWGGDFDDDGVMNPGDSFDFSYTLANEGSKSIDVKQTIVLTSSEALTDSAEEYKLTITGGNDAVAVTPNVSSDKKTLTYDLTDIILDGRIETEAGSKTTTTDYTVKLDFDEGAKNRFMDSDVILVYKAYAKQHRNTQDVGWTEVASYESYDASNAS